MRPFRFSLALAALFALAACAVSSGDPPPASGANGLMTWPDLLERPRPEPTATIAYGEDSLQVADLWLPEGGGLHPVVLMVHGGCWQTEIADRRIMNWIADDLRRRGIAVWNIEYRGVDRPGGGYPGTFVDAAQAADAIRVHAARHRLDLSRLVAVGHSAGGHLALWLAARPAALRRMRGVRITVRDPDADAATLQRRAVEPIIAAATAAVRPDETLTTVRDGVATLDLIFRDHITASEAAYTLGEGPALNSFSGEDLMIETPSLDLASTSPLVAGVPLEIPTVISLGGLPDLEEAARPPGSGCGRDVIARIAGAASEERPDPYADTSVPRLGPLGVVQVLINGMQDRIIPTAYAEGYARPMRAAGDEVRVRMLERTGHVELIAPDTAAWAAAVEEIQRALGESERG
jgi:acetyl esterase/lipase